MNCRYECQSLRDHLHPLSMKDRNCHNFKISTKIYTMHMLSQDIMFEAIKFFFVVC
jgi:hypothetical protein